MAQKKGMKLLWKFLLLALLPLFVAFVIAQYAISSVAGEVSKQLVHNMLSSNVYIMDTLIEEKRVSGEGAAGMQEVLDNAKKQTGGSVPQRATLSPICHRISYDARYCIP